MKHLKIPFLLFFLLLTTASQAQVMEGAAGKREALKMGLYPPDLIMRHQQRLGVTADQRSQMSTAVKTFQSEVAELQWTLQSEQQALKQMLAQKRIEASAALAQVDKVVALENAFKRAHFGLLISIKNALTEEQIDMINREIKDIRERRSINKEN